MALDKRLFENIPGKGENAGNQLFLLFPPCFSTHPNLNFNFWVTFILSSANAFNLDWSKILLFGKELMLCQDDKIKLKELFADKNFNMVQMV